MADETQGTNWAPIGLLHAIWRYRWAVGIAAALGAAAGFFGSALLPTRYEAVATLQLADPERGGVFGVMPEAVEGEVFVLDEAQRIASAPVLQRAADALDSITVDELRDDVEGSPLVEFNSVRITAGASTAERAAEIANAVAIAYQQVTREQRRERATVATNELQGYIDRLRQDLQVADIELEALRAEAIREAEATTTVPSDETATLVAASQILETDVEYQTLLLDRQAILSQLRTATDTAEQIRIDAEVLGSGVRRFDRAEVPDGPAQPQRELFGAVAGLLGFLGAAGLAWRLSEDRAAAKRSQDAASSVGAPLLGDVPAFRSPATVPWMSGRRTASRPRSIAVPYSTAGESFQYILSSVLASVDTNGRAPVLVTTGTVRGDGGTTTALNLGFAASQRQLRVVVFDADFRERSLSKLCGLGAESGVSESHDSQLPAYEIAHQGRLKVVPTGNAFGDAIGYLNSSNFAGAVLAARSTYDLVVLDAPPVLAAADALTAARAADGVVLVVGSGRSLDDLGEAARVLGRAPAPLVGYVFNRPRRGWVPRFRTS